MINLVRYSITSATKRANRHSDKDDGTTEQNVELMRLNASAANYHVDRSQSTPDVTLRVLFFYVLSLILYIFDVGSDIGVAYQHYDNGHVSAILLWKRINMNFVLRFDAQDYCLDIVRNADYNICGPAVVIIKRHGAS